MPQEASAQPQEASAQPKRQLAFHLTGAADGHLEPVDSGVRPALLANCCDLASLRYDFPVVLVEDRADGLFVRSLTSVVDELLQEIAPRGIEGERVRRAVLRAEREIRTLVAEGARGMLSDLWSQAAPDLADVRTHLPLDGELADCDRELPRRLVEHGWRSVQRRKAGRFHAEVNRLVQALSDILRAAFIHSEAGRRTDSLRAGFGSLHHDQFDFETMSRLLGQRAPRDDLPADRRGRIEWALAVLTRQRFFEPPPGTEFAQAAEPPFVYRYTSCADAVDAFRERLPQLVEFVKAVSIAELEADGGYVSSQHDSFFADFDEQSLSSEDLTRFPDYLVCVDRDESTAAMIELLSSGLPVRVLVETEEPLERRLPRGSARSTQVSVCRLRGRRGTGDGRCRLHLS